MERDIRIGSVNTAVPANTRTHMPTHTNPTRTPTHARTHKIRKHSVVTEVERLKLHLLGSWQTVQIMSRDALL